MGEFHPKDYGFITITEAAKQAVDQIKNHQEGNVIFYKTPFPRLNKTLLGGLYPHKFYVIAGRPGCLSGDSLLYISRKEKGSGRKYSLKELYYKFNNVKCSDGSITNNKWDLSIKTLTQSYKNDERLTGLNEIESVFQSGIKTLYEVTTETGRKIKATLEHPFLIDSALNEYKELKHLSIGDYVFCKKPAISFGRKKRVAKKEHRSIHNDRSKFGKNYVDKEKIVSIKEVGEEMTYDITMKSPYNNFISDGFVVHNSGKSAFVNSLIFGMLDDNLDKKIVVFYWSFEMPGKDQILRIASNKSHMEMKDLLSVNTKLSDSSLASFTKIAYEYGKYPIYINEKSRSSDFIYDFNVKAKQSKNELQIINLIDHARLVESEDDSENKKLTDLSHSLIQLQQETNCINILLSHLNRNIEDKGRISNQFQPMLSDLFGADSIGQDADFVGIINRPFDLYGIRKPYLEEDPVNLLALHVEKNRGGPLGMIPFEADMSKFKITERHEVLKIQQSI